MSDITITLHDPSTGRSESLPVPGSLTIQEVLDLGTALLDLERSSGGGTNGRWVLTRDGRPLGTPGSGGSPSQTLAGAGVSSGDLLAVVRAAGASSSASSSSSSSAAEAAASGGLDFSGLLAGASASASAASGGGARASAAAGGLDFTGLLVGGGSNSGSSSNSSNNNPTPVYYAGMSFEEALESNPHPRAIVTLLRTHSNLFKEFNYHMPVLAKKIQGAPSFDKAVETWRKEMVSSSIRSAAARTDAFHRERTFRERLQRNPNDEEAKAYFEKKDNLLLVNEQYRQAMQEYPESMGRVLMLYINASINHHPLQAFVDSGAQTTIMSKSCARRCGIFHLLDTRFHGTAVGVGTGKILGRIHIVQLQIGDYHFPCSVTVMDDAAIPTAQAGAGNSASAKPKDMDLLLGLDMLKRFNCSIDLLDSKLKFRLGGTVLETPFLHEKDLDESKGGTKGFDAAEANRRLEELQRRHHEGASTGNGGGETNDDDDEENDQMYD